MHDVFVKLIRPVLAATKDYGNCSIQQKREFVYGIDSFIKFMRSKKLFHIFYRNLLNLKIKRHQGRSRDMQN